MPRRRNTPAAVQDSAQDEAALSVTEQQEEPSAPDPIPLSAKISSLEFEGDTRAFATAEYGGLTIRRIRVKENYHGDLFIAMPKYRQANGFADTCFFNTPEAKNRLTDAVLGAYRQTLAQVQALSPQQQEDDQETGEPEQDTGPVMGGMSGW